MVIKGLNVAEMDNTFVQAHNDYENNALVNSLTMKEFLDEQYEDFGLTIDDLDCPVKIVNTQNHKKVYRKLRAFNKTTSNTVELGGRTRRALDIKNGDLGKPIVDITRVSNFCYLWHTGDSSVRRMFIISFLSLIVAIISLLITFITNC